MSVARPHTRRGLVAVRLPPRWSEPNDSGLLPASIAGFFGLDPPPKRCVAVGPPLKASLCRNGHWPVSVPVGTTVRALRIRLLLLFAVNVTDEDLPKSSCTPLVQLLLEMSVL